jgi:hypothetical protein
VHVVHWQLLLLLLYLLLQFLLLLAASLSPRLGHAVEPGSAVQ